MRPALRIAAPLIVTIVCLAVLTVRITGMHAHRDAAVPSQEPSHAHTDHHFGHRHYHHHDDGSAHAHDDGQVDVEVDALTGGLKAAGKASLWLAALFVLWRFTVSSHRRAVPRPPDRAGLAFRAGVRWRPPLRGPPGISIA